jgi:hypothetical protein
MFLNTRCGRVVFSYSYVKDQNNIVWPQHWGTTTKISLQYQWLPRRFFGPPNKYCGKMAKTVSTSETCRESAAFRPVKR